MRLWLLQHGVGDVFALSSRLGSLWLSPIQGVETPEPGSSGPVQPQQFRTRALWPRSLPSPCLVSWGKKTALLLFFVCSSGHSTPWLAVSGLVFTDPHFRSFGTCAFLPPLQTGDHLSAPPTAISFILLNMPTESNHD